ncbi:MAG: carbohydrate ABC transporter permease [Gaiellaceae bacterium]|jgi:multiple sugar transport system permease protein
MTIPRRYLFRIIALVILLAFTAFFFVPMIWLFLAPSKTDGQLLAQSPFSFGSFRTLVHTFHNIIKYDAGAGRDTLLVWLKNSAIYSFGGTALAILAAIPAGYGLALTQFIGRRALLGITLVVMIMPATALVLPLFLEMEKINLVGTIWSLILPFGFFPFGVYLAYIYFSSTIPKDLLAAARIDGAGEWRVFRYIAFPLASPIVALVGFFAFVASWNNFFLPFVMTYDSSQYPVQIGLNQLIASTPVFNSANFVRGAGQYAPYRPDLAAAVIVAIAPVLIVFLFAQRALVTGMLAGATKE